MGALYDDWIENYPHLESYQYFHPEKYCRGCGFLHDGKYKFCPECGKKLK